MSLYNKIACWLCFAIGVLLSFALGWKLGVAIALVILVFYPAERKVNGSNDLEV